VLLLWKQSLCHQLMPAAAAACLHLQHCCCCCHVGLRLCQQQVQQQQVVQQLQQLLLAELAGAGLYCCWLQPLTALLTLVLRSILPC
jgi:hypothetical protein